jgi:hypothetical protein
MVIDKSAQQTTHDWMSLMKVHLDNQPSSDDNAEVEHTTRKSRMYNLIDELLY